MCAVLDDSFELVPAAGGGLVPLIGALERLLARVPAERDHAVIVGRRATHPSPHYVQFMVHPDGTVYAEAASNDYTAPHAIVDATQHAALLELGWHPPDDVDHAAGARPCSYWHGWAPPARLREAATLAIVSLFDVYGLDRMEPLVDRVFPGVRKPRIDRRPVRDACGGIVGQLRRRSDEELAAWIRGSRRLMDEQRASGDGYAAWWASKLLSSGLTEQRRRAHRR